MTRYFPSGHERRSGSVVRSEQKIQKKWTEVLGITETAEPLWAGQSEGVEPGQQGSTGPAGPGTDAPPQPVMSRDRAAAAPGGEALQTGLSSEEAPPADGGPAADKRLLSSGVVVVAVAAREAQQAGENPSEPPPTNPVLVPPQQVEKRFNVEG